MILSVKSSSFSDANENPFSLSVITSINGEKFNNIVDFARLLYAKETGDELNLEIVQLRQRGLFVRRSTGKLSLKLL